MASSKGSPRSAAGFFAPAVFRFSFTNLFERLLDWQERSSQRIRLMELDDRMLRDIGLTRADALYEFEKSRWRR